MTLKEIMETWLKEQGYDGLYDFQCGCEVTDFMPCDQPSQHCEPGYKSASEDPEYDFLIGPKKQS